MGWLSSDTSGVVEDVWTKVKVLSQNGPLVTVRLMGKKSGVLHIDLRTDHLEAANDTVESDLTALHHMNEAAILQNLQERSYADEPYTFMGNVMVAVNPLRFSKEPKGALGKRHAVEIVHPYAVAEVAYQQMSFRGNQMRREKEDLVDQSIVTSGESGAGKTENAKMLMRHLVYRAGEESSELAARMLESNTILEAFGNAGTLRNHNSSRFGKLMKLWFKQGESKVGELPVFTIEHASITTYLLEQSRITLHGFGEHNFHIFYYLLNGDDDLKADLKLSNKCLKKEAGKYGFRYLDPVDLDDLQTGQRKRRGKKSAPPMQSVSAEIARSKDASNYLTLMLSFEDYGIDGEKLSNMLKILGGVLHVGNVMFKEKEGTHTDQAEEDTSAYEASYSPMHVAAELLEVNADSLTALLTSRKLKVRGESSIVTLSAKGASIARDSLSRLIYVGLFDWIVRTINEELGHNKVEESHHFIGILDIFGFEVFKLNTFEQLLINYANEALQGTFERSVFQHEMELYKREGLLRESDDAPMEVPDNSICLELFEGQKKGAGKSKAKKNLEIGLLKLIDAESHSIKPSDEKLNASLHRVYDNHSCFGRIHPNDRREKFIVLHYAGAVTYTVGSFVKKNRNGFLKPEDMIELLGRSSNPILADIMETTGAVFKEAESKHIKAKTVVGKFHQQIHELIDTLENTSTSFVRCIKPNPSLTRAKNSKTWFNRRYVSAQLSTLSIPQTVKVLSTGYPTRIPYKTLMEQYKSMLPKDAVERWEQSKSPDTKGFIEALFYAFEVERSKFKLGYSKVFFKSGQIGDLEKVFSASQSWQSDKAAQEAFVKRFKGYYIRKRWRVAYAKVIALNRFKHMAIAVHERRERERLERERKERERKARLRKQWRVAIIYVRVQVRLLHLYEEVKEKRRLAEEARQAELAKKSEEERAAAEEEEKKKRAAEEQAMKEAAEKAELKKAESVREILNKKLNEENEEIARIEEKEKETLAKIEEQRSLRQKEKEEEKQEGGEEEKEEEDGETREGTSILAELKRYDPLGRLGAQWELNKKRVVDAVGAKKREQVLKEEAISHVEAIQAEREKEQRRLEKQAQENLRALNIDLDLDDEDLKRAREKDAEDAKKLIALEEERLKFENLLEEHKEEKEKAGEEEEKEEEPEGKVESAVEVFKKYDWDIFDWEKHEVTEEDVEDESTGMTKDMIGQVYYYNAKTGARQWDPPQITVFEDKDEEEEEENKENKELVKKAHDQAVAHADRLDLTPRERAEMIANLEKKYLHNLATNKVAMGLMSGEGAVARFYHRFKNTHFFKHAEHSAEEKLKEAEEKHAKAAEASKQKKKRRSILSRLHLHSFHHGHAKKEHEHVVDPNNNAVKKVVKLTEEQAKNPALAARQHAEALDGLVEEGKITPMEHVQLKGALVEAASRDQVKEKRGRASSKAADVQVHCPNCDTIINTANGSVCPNCSYELKSELAKAPKLEDRTESDEDLDKAHYEKKNWNLTINSRKGKLRVRIGHSKTEYEEMSARDLTFFELEVLLEKVEVKSKKEKTKESSFRQWLVIHSFTEFLDLSKEIHSGKLGKDNLKKSVRAAIKPIPEPSSNTFIEEDVELIVNANPAKYQAQIEEWLGRMSHVLNKKDKKFGRPLFSSPEMDSFFELTDHSPEEFDATFSF